MIGFLLNTFRLTERREYSSWLLYSEEGQEQQKCSRWGQLDMQDSPRFLGAWI
jgi:hypothetical protein